jgi:hypothetical protein
MPSIFGQPAWLALRNGDGWSPATTLVTTLTDCDEYVDGRRSVIELRRCGGRRSRSPLRSVQPLASKLSKPQRARGVGDEVGARRPRMIPVHVDRYRLVGGRRLVELTEEVVERQRAAPSDARLPFGLSRTQPSVPAAWAMRTCEQASQRGGGGQPHH